MWKGINKICVLSTSKTICQVKKEFMSNSLAQIHLPNPDLTYIKNPERETKLCFYLSLIENLNKEF
jgi:hypothetical protein